MGRGRSSARAFSISLLSVSLLWAFGVLGRVENNLAARFVDALAPHLQTRLAGEIAIIAAEESAGKNGSLKAFDESWRRYHAQLIEALARCGARVVAFDMTFRDPAPGDGEMAQAIERAAKLGVRVIVGAEGFVVRDGIPVPQISTDLRPHVTASQWALVSAGARAADSGVLRRAELARLITALPASNVEIVEARVVPSLAVQMAAQYRSGRDPAEVRLLAKENRLRIASPAGEEIETIPAGPRLDAPIEMPGSNELERITQQYHVVWSNRAKLAYLEDNFKDKIVLIACRLAGDTHKLGGGQTRYGYEVHAALLSALLQRRIARPVSSWLAWLAILGMSASVVVLHLWFPGARARRLTLPALKWIEFRPSLTVTSVATALAYLALAFVLFQSRRLVVEFSYPLLALVVADLAAGRAPAAKEAK